MSRRRTEFVAVSTAYAIAVGTATLLGYRMSIDWSLYQLLDPDLLREHTTQSLMLLHGQPPLLNALLAGILKVSAGLGVAPERIAGAFFVAVGFVLAHGLFAIVRTATGSTRAAAAGLAYTLLDPAFHHFGNTYFYSFLVDAQTVLLAAAAGAYVQGGRARHLAFTVALLASVPLMRSAFPPLWAGLAFALVVLGRRWVSGRWSARQAGIAAAALTALLVIWPAKNQVVFGQFTDSSWRGFNLVRGTTVEEPVLERFLRHGEVQSGLQERARRIADRYGPQAADQLVRTHKSGGALNWNHLVFVETAPALTEGGMDWRRRNPGSWMTRAAAQYAMWSRATYAHPYEPVLLGTGTSGDLRKTYVEAHHTLFFPDLRPGLERWIPTPGVHATAWVRGRPVPYTLFGLIVFPLVIAGAAVRFVRRVRDRRAADWLVALALLTVLWSVAAPCLTDGQEGNRMRYGTGGLLTVLALYAAAGLLAYLRGADAERAARA